MRWKWVLFLVRVITCCRSAWERRDAFNRRYPLISSSKNPLDPMPSTGVWRTPETPGSSAAAGSPTCIPRTPAGGDLEGLWDGSRSAPPTPVERSSALARSALARCSALWSSTKSSSSRTRSWGIVSPLVRLIPDHFSNLWNESGMGSFWSGDSLKVPNGLSRPVVESKSFGSKFLTTDFADPCNLCQILGAASRRSDSFKEHSYQRHEVQNPSKLAGSPSTLGLHALQALATVGLLHEDAKDTFKDVVRPHQ